MYITKTEERINNIDSSELKSLLELPSVKINDFEYLGFESLKSKVFDLLIKYINEVDFFSVIHGDYCFSNILFNIESQLVKLIDPRGEFGEVGIYGDPAYDIAKLRHSLISSYDFIVRDLFSLNETSKNEFDFTIYETPLELRIFFDSLVSELYDISYIKLIEGLLYISMLPLHKDSIDRQKAMYLTGIKILNEVLNNENCN